MGDLSKYIKWGLCARMYVDVHSHLPFCLISNIHVKIREYIFIKVYLSIGQNTLRHQIIAMEDLVKDLCVCVTLDTSICRD